MFGNCVWLQLNSTHNLNQNIINFSKLFYYPIYKAHVTLEYDYKKKFKKKDFKIDNLIRDGEPNITNNNGFYAFEQNYYFENEPSKMFHISLAYKNNKTFTNTELFYLKSIKIDEKIDKKDLEIHLWNCNSKNPKDWKMIY